MLTVTRHQNADIEAVPRTRPAPKRSAAARLMTPPPSSYSNVLEPRSPTVEDVRCALRAQTAPTKKMVKSVCEYMSPAHVWLPFISLGFQ
jgi:hypothetical protein